MAQPFLALQHRNSAHQVYRVIAASPQTLGDPLPTPGLEDDSTVGETTISNFNRVIQFQGDIYAAARNGVYKKDTPTSTTGPWSIDHTFTNPASADRSFHIHGPYYIVLSGVPSLFVIWATSAGATTWNAAILNGNTDVWSEVGEQVAVNADNATAYGKQIVYRGVLYVFYEGGILTFDPDASSFGVISLGAQFALPQRAGPGIFNDRLLFVGRNSISGDVALYEIVGGVVSPLFDTSLADQGGVNEVPRHTLVPSPDGSVLYAFITTSTGGDGLGLLKIIDTAGTLSESADLTVAVIPAALQPGSGGTDVRSWAFYDQETTSGNADLLIHTTPGGASSDIITQYLFIDEVSTLSQQDQGANAVWAFSASMVGGGERVFTPGELNIQIVDKIAVLGGEAIRFKAYGDVGSADKNVEFRHNTENEVPLVLATLTGTPTVVSGPAAAPTLNVGLKRLEGVEADDTSVYEVVWDVAVDSITVGQRAQLVPRVFV